MRTTLFVFTFTTYMSLNTIRIISKQIKYYMKLSIPATTSAQFSKYIERPPITFTPNQIQYQNYMKNSSIKLLFAVGPAGTGKTMIACNYAIEEFKKKNIDKIIITRPIITVPEEDIGFLPGKMQTKMQPWIQPILDVFQETYSKKQVVDMMDGGQIEICSLMHMRGRTFKNAIVIADEIQNTTPKQMYLLLTRCGKNCRMILTGDLNQSDLQGTNGLGDFIEKYTKYEKEASQQQSNENMLMDPVSPISPIKMVFFNETDIQRSATVNTVIQIYSLQSPAHRSSFVESQKKTCIPFEKSLYKGIDYTEVP